MIDTRHLLLPATAALALAGNGPAAAQASAWTVVPPRNGASSMTGTLEGLTLAYSRAPDDIDHVRLTIANCDGSPWEMDEGLMGATVETLRRAAKEEFDNARLSCTLSDGVEDRLMAGVDEAFAKVKPVLPPRMSTIGGWEVADVGGMPGDDSERLVTITRMLGGLKITYLPDGSVGGAMVFECEGANYGTNFGFGNPAQSHVEVVTDQMTEAYAGLEKDCKPKPPAQAAMMQNFPEALNTLEQWLAAKPFVYPPVAASSEQEQ